MMRRMIIVVLVLLIVILFTVRSMTETESTSTNNSDDTSNEVSVSEEQMQDRPDNMGGQMPSMNGTMNRMPNRSFNGTRQAGGFPAGMNESMQRGQMPPNDSLGGANPGMDGMQSGMLEACEGKSEGDTCTSEGPMGEEEGTCTLMNEELLCMTGRQDDMMMPPEMG